jgi:hypothetical protein
MRVLGGSVAALFGALLMAGVITGCGSGSGGTTTQGARTWSVTVANNIGPQSGPNPITATQAVVAAYRRTGLSPVEVNGCHASNGELLWECNVKTSRTCTATVQVAFDGPHDTTGQVQGASPPCISAEDRKVASIMRSCFLRAHLRPAGATTCAQKRIGRAVDRGELPASYRHTGITRATVADVIPKNGSSP